MENKNNILESMSRIRGMTGDITKKREKNAVPMQKGSVAWLGKLKQEIHSLKTFIQAHSL